MAAQHVALWKATPVSVITDSITDVAVIASAARQLRDRERNQIEANIAAGHYEVAASFIWHKTMALLKRQLATLGQQFVAELLQRPDIDEYADLSIAISDADALGLAKDLGMITATQAMRLAHAQEVINHFASVDSNDALDDTEGMTPEEAVGCLRVCVQGVLGQERVAVAEDFAAFRGKLESETLAEGSPELVRLQGSPYFFIRTAISILLSVLKTKKGAQLENASRNAIFSSFLCFGQHSSSRSVGRSGKRTRVSLQTESESWSRRFTPLWSLCAASTMCPRTFARTLSRG